MTNSQGYSDKSTTTESTTDESVEAQEPVVTEEVVEEPKPAPRRKKQPKPEEVNHRCKNGGLIQPHGTWSGKPNFRCRDCRATGLNPDAIVCSLARIPTPDGDDE